MDFFERQDRARKKTKWLVVYFLLAVVLMIAAIYVAMAALFLRESKSLWNQDIFLGVAGGTIAIIVIGSLTKIISLREGGGVVARALGGEPLEGSSRDLDEQKLLNVVEEMAIASGVAVPEVYVLNEEDGINAFAAGHTPGEAAIGVTRGALRTLNREELQGVVAHEFSHILNGDMRLNLRLMGMVHGILCLAIVGRVLLRTGSRRAYLLGSRSKGKGGNPLPLIGIVLIIIGSIGVFFGRLIKSAISRQREFLADSAAVQFTRNPGGLAGALKKIGGLSQGSRLESGHAEEASHLFFGNCLGQSWLSLMSTHPPLEERIRALDPSFDGKFPVVELAGPSGAASSMAHLIPDPQAARAMPSVQRLAGGDRLRATPPRIPPVRAEQIVRTAGAPTAAHLQFAAQWRDSLSPAVLAAAHEPHGACALVYTLCLSDEAEARAQQLTELREKVSIEVFQKIQESSTQPVLQEKIAKLPLVDLCISTLRKLSPVEFQDFAANLKWIIEHDRQIDLFEYALQKVVVRHLERHFSHARPAVTQYYSLRPLLPDAVVIVAALAHAGHDDPADMQRSFTAGVTRLPGLEAGAVLPPLEQCDLALVDVALNRLALATFHIKRLVLEAAAQTVAADGAVHPREAELLRAVADTLDCPLPPLLVELAAQAPAGPSRTPV